MPLAGIGDCTRSLMSTPLHVSLSSTLHDAPGRAVQQVFVSYAWGDDSPEGRQREQVVERLCERLRDWGYDVVRDRDQMRRGDLISEFMRRIGRGDRVVVVLSEKYL